MDEKRLERKRSTMGGSERKTKEEKEKTRTMSERKKKEEEIKRKNGRSEARIRERSYYVAFGYVKTLVCILRISREPTTWLNTITCVLCKDHPRDFQLKLLKHTHLSVPFQTPTKSTINVFKGV